MKKLTTTDQKDYVPTTKELTGIQKKQTPIKNAKAKLSGAKLTTPTKAKKKTPIRDAIRKIGARTIKVDNAANPASAHSMMKRATADKAKGKAKGTYHY